MELKEAKKVIIDHIDELLTIKLTKWEYVNGKYREVDIKRSKKEMNLLEGLQYRDMKQYYDLKELLEEWI